MGWFRLVKVIWMPGKFATPRSFFLLGNTRGKNGGLWEVWGNLLFENIGQSTDRKFHVCMGKY